MQPGQQRLTGFVQPQPPADTEDTTPAVRSYQPQSPLRTYLCCLVRIASSCIGLCARSP